MKKILLLGVGLCGIFILGCQKQKPLINDSSTSQSSIMSVSSQSLASSSLKLAPDDIVICDKSPNAYLQKEILITLGEKNDPRKYSDSRKNAIDLINKCYNVILKEEYEITKGQINIQQGEFKGKIINTDSVFDKLKFYPNMNLSEYNGFVGTDSLTYATIDPREKILEFYNGLNIEGFRQTPSDDSNILRWTDVETSNKFLTVQLLESLDFPGQIFLKFSYSELQD